MKSNFTLNRALNQIFSEKSVIVHCELTPEEMERRFNLANNIKPSDFYNEAIGLIDFHGGCVPQGRDWKEQCRPYFENCNIDSVHWDTIYYEALTLQEQA